jgi:glycerol uptake facilitator protein
VAGKFPWIKVGPFILAQMIGAGIGTILVWLSYRDHYTKTKNTNAKLATFCTAPAIRNNFSNILTEAIGTFILVFAVLYIAIPEFHTDMVTNGTVGLGSLGALPVALIVIVIGMSLGGPTGYAINPARDLGPRIMHALLPIGEKRDSNWSYSWIPIAGPILGGMIAAGLYLLLQ